MLVRVGNGKQQGLDQTLDLWIADDTANLQRNSPHLCTCNIC